MPFSAEVTACEATIDPSLVILTDKAVVWGDRALPYNIGAALASYQQKPNCAYDFAWTILYEDVLKAPGMLTDQNPPEIQYNEITRNFVIEKCSDEQRPFE